MIKHVQKTFRPSLTDFAAAYRRLKFLHVANRGKHQPGMIAQALHESDEQVMASVPKPEVKRDPEAEPEAA